MVELELRDMLHLDVMTVTGKTLGENLEDLEKENFFQRNLGYLHNYGLEREQVIFPVEKAREKGSVAILRGNLAPDGAVIKYSACTEAMRERKGPARVFNCEEDAYQAVVDKKVAPGDMLIILAYSVKNRSLDIVGIRGEEKSPEEIEEILQERRKAGILPRPERKGLLKRYTSHALSAMEGAGYDC